MGVFLFCLFSLSPFFSCSHIECNVPERRCEKQTNKQKTGRMERMSRLIVADGKAYIWHMVWIKGAVCNFFLEHTKVISTLESLHSAMLPCD